MEKSKAIIVEKVRKLQDNEFLFSDQHIISAKHLRELFDFIEGEAGVKIVVDKNDYVLWNNCVHSGRPTVIRVEKK